MTPRDLQGLAIPRALASCFRWAPGAQRGLQELSHCLPSGRSCHQFRNLALPAYQRLFERPFPPAAEGWPTCPANAAQPPPALSHAVIMRSPRSGHALFHGVQTTFKELISYDINTLQACIRNAILIRDKRPVTVLDDDGEEDDDKNEHLRQALH